MRFGAFYNSHSSIGKEGLKETSFSRKKNLTTISALDFKASTSFNLNIVAENAKMSLILFLVSKCGITKGLKLRPEKVERARVCK